MTLPDKPRALLIGAYERDNFGDLLFLLVTERYFAERGIETVASAPLGADMSELLGRHVQPSWPALNGSTFDHIWTVGGEVGGTTMRDALRMSAAPDVYERYRRSAPADRLATMKRLTGADPSEAAYMVRPTAHPRNASASLVLNSVGLSGIAALHGRELESQLAILREADHIAVRDHRSAQLLITLGVAHKLVPDVVHSIALSAHRTTVPRETVLVQGAEQWIRTVGAQKLAAAIASSMDLAPYPIRLMLAGTAAGHDSTAAYAEVIRLVRQIEPQRDIAFSTASRRPWDLVDEISSARLWIGTSLHGRIVAAAHDVPRISFADPKLDTYATTWDPDMPFGVTPRSLDRAVREALSPTAASKTAGLGARLGRMADEGIQEALDAVVTVPSSDRTASRFAALEDLRLRQVNRREQSVGWIAEDWVAAVQREARADLRKRAHALRLRLRS